MPLPFREVGSPADSTPHESPADSRSSNIYGYTSLADARSEQSADTVDTASACAPAVSPAQKRLRTIEKIRREHPDAVRAPLGIAGGKFCASWQDASKDGGWNSEKCL